MIQTNVGAPRSIAPGLHAIPLGVVNAFLIDAGELTLIDTGIPGSADKVLQAVRALGRRPEHIRHILITHCHADHSGSLAALKRTTRAAAYMHPTDATLVRTGKIMRPMKAAPGLVNGLFFKIFISRAPQTIEPAEIEYEVNSGEDLPIAGGIRAIHAPGHCAGQLVFLWRRHGGVLFAGDAASNVIGLGLSPGYENLDEGRRSLMRIAGLDFETACFGHGGAILRGASRQFRRKWGGP
ncbi:MAG: MBL fold metallo-hydrolase [Armatimonadota bacterium]